MKIFGYEIKRSSIGFEIKGPSKSRQQISNAGRYRVRTTNGQRSYDAAEINRHTARHFLDADGRDADSLIRESLPTLRNRARYEIRNNSYAKGICETKANDIVGAGPRLQVQTDNPDFDNKVEDLFSRFMLNCDAGGKMAFADILRLAGSLQQDGSGEAFIVMTDSGAGGKQNGVRLRLQVIEPDRVTTPWGMLGAIGVDTEKIRNGIEVDENGRPVAYYILKKHPGSTSVFGGLGMTGEYDRVGAEHVIHLYRQDRPGQTRGVPWLTPSIPLFAYLRRYTLATVAAAETAADISAVLETEGEGTDDDKVDTMDEVEIARNAMLTLPINSKMSQFKPEQPSANYKEFKYELINELARCLNMPFNVAAGNSAGYNYASGRLDWQVYFRAIKTIQAWIERIVCNRIFFAWLREAQLIGEYGLAQINPSKIKVQWFWPGQEHVDPVKEAVAQTKRLENKTTSLATEYAKQGLDWERELKQIAKEEEKLKELGLKAEKLQNRMEDLARGVRSGVPIAVAEARTALGLAEEPPESGLLRFNDQDVLQYHIESGILTINEIRNVLGLKKVDWGDVPVRKTGVSPVDPAEKKENAEEDADESETEKESE